MFRIGMLGATKINDSIGSSIARSKKKKKKKVAAADQPVGRREEQAQPMARCKGEPGATR
jgi:hypothetical protein